MRGLRVVVRWARPKTSCCEWTSPENEERGCTEKQPYRRSGSGRMGTVIILMETIE
ncbi:hypothetical protein PCA31118_03439 [Pandoraea captiosa]|uniref:Uncharacterized protein n=1 Tax=Pandoraea captiosa TaxID=2508302 RepID=A0A5E5ABE2_9BURK|nr:hypothetical protein PCA31118_03439 [Pandoraea captiosa]